METGLQSVYSTYVNYRQHIQRRLSLNFMQQIPFLSTLSPPFLSPFFPSLCLFPFFFPLPLFLPFPLLPFPLLPFSFPFPFTQIQLEDLRDRCELPPPAESERSHSRKFNLVHFR